MYASGDGPNPFAVARNSHSSTSVLSVAAAAMCGAPCHPACACGSGRAPCMVLLAAPSNAASGMGASVLFLAAEAHVSAGRPSSWCGGLQFSSGLLAFRTLCWGLLGTYGCSAHRLAVAWHAGRDCCGGTCSSCLSGLCTSTDACTPRPHSVANSSAAVVAGGALTRRPGASCDVAQSAVFFARFWLSTPELSGWAPVRFWAERAHGAWKAAWLCA
ncbi:hypothetical protein COO60DRAFT_760519 [Scenedesmus sp. NREL 46B-D3]|nr:hypothetical protein COO60DRAFT_760519 [Scenedesmus sp. NREL 46B-D3]